MKMLILPLFLILISPYAVAEDLLKARDWTSNEGATLKAELVVINKETITLKRQTDGKVVNLNISKLSKIDNDLIEIASTKIDQLIKELSDLQTKVSLNQLSENNWDLAYRIGKHHELWKAITKIPANINSSYRRNVLSLVPRLIKKETNQRYIVYGDKIVLRLIAPLTTNNDKSVRLNISGDILEVVKDQGYRTIKSPILTKNQDFGLVLTYGGQLITCAPEKIGITEYLVITYQLDHRMY